MKHDKLTLIARVVLGLPFVIFGLNGFFHFIPMPPLPAEAMTFMVGLMASGYFIPFLKITEIVCGVLILTGRYVPLALVVLAPVIINIVLFNLFLAPQGLLLPIILTVMEVFLLLKNKDKYKALLEK